MALRAVTAPWGKRVNNGVFQEEDDNVQCVGSMDKLMRSATGMLKYFPILKWGSEYSSNDFWGDINAGLTVGVAAAPPFSRALLF